MSLPDTIKPTSQANSTDGKALELEAFLPYRLSILSNRVSNAIASVYSERFGLTIPGWRVMAILGRYGNLSAAELVEMTAMDKVAISRAVSQLLDQAYIDRREDTADRRRLVLNLSRQGKKIYRQIVPLARRYEQELIAGLSPAQVSELHAMIDQLLTTANHWQQHGLTPN